MKLSESIGWKKNNICIDKSIEKEKDFEIIKSGNSIFYKTSIKQLSYEEALLVEKVINAFRKESNEYNKELINELILDYCDQNHIITEKEHKQELMKYIKMEIKGFSILDVLLKDENLEEIAVLNNQKPIYVYHKKYGWLETDIIINDEKKIRDIINKISRNLGRRITLQKPRVNANLKFGRMHAAIPPIAFSGSCMTIRKFNSSLFSPFDLIENKTVSSEAMAFIWLAIQCDINVLIAGNTGSGKTTTMNAIFEFIPKNERIIIVEETPEIFLPHKNQVKLNVCPELDIKMHELVTDSLRMRPDRIIVGEVRDSQEVKALINTMLAGQGKSSFATFHAQNSEEALIRMISLGINPIDLHALDLIIIQRRWSKYEKNGEQKDIRRVIEIASIKKEYLGKPKIEILFAYDPKKDCLVRKNLFNSHVFEKICLSFDFDKKEFEQELEKRKKTLEVKNVHK